MSSQFGGVVDSQTIEVRPEQPEKADAIILDGMGTQFDPSLEKYYVAARPQFEAYYLSQLNADATQSDEEEKKD